MKVLFFCGVPFFLAHGGSQTLTEALMSELATLGVEVEPARWWDDTQMGDILHFIGRPSTLNVRLAHAKGMKVVMTDLLDQTASRHGARLLLQRCFTALSRKVIPKFTGQLNWEVYQEIDGMVYAVPHEWEVAKYLFGATPTRGRVIPHGLDEAVLRELGEPDAEEGYLISVATIDERKNSVLLAQAAHKASVPIVFLGRPYAENSPYFHRFKDLVDGVFVRYPGFVSAAEKHRYLRRARGFTSLSRFESGCIAVFEASAAGLPLLLPALPWAKKSYPDAKAINFLSISRLENIAEALSRFYQGAHRLPQPNFPVLSWRAVAEQYVAFYRQIAAR